MRQMSRRPNLGILLSHFSFPSLRQADVASVTSVTDCDLPHLSNVIWCIQWFLVHWGISSIQNSRNLILVEWPKILSKKEGFFPIFSAKITQIYILFFGEWAPICKYREIETCYALETWDYYRDYICARNTKKLKKYLQNWPRKSVLTHWPVWLSDRWMTVCSIGLLKFNWTRWMIFGLHLKEMGATCWFGPLFYLFPAKGHPSSRWNEAFEESIEEFFKWKLKQLKTSLVELS